MTVIEKLKWRYATKKFDSTKKIPSEILNELLESTELAPSSYGLQPFKILVIEDQAIREKLKSAAYGQTQITDASQLIVFARIKNFGIEQVEEYADNIADTRNIDPKVIEGFVDVMKGTVNSLSEEQLAVWNSKQCYLALGFLLFAAAQQKIDACPMEGFDAAKFDEILDLDAQNLSSVVIATIGYRSEDDDYQNLSKVRKSKEELFITI
ncbi:NAD(P)H-dependent oxidoreductase [Daejeonella oryzae]|uniref:NAD(P)H-dependent oxidoreductase n=1 Tax=Daejeonella oryzae TaxID=1122943 RepID=UPI00041487A5|nr:NAD(P)H-dependent oxidoreductase [Daejeonella oryzae]